MSKKLDLLGQRFGRLVVVDSAPNKKCKGGQTKTVWKCKCDCGNFCYVTTQELRKGDTVSCGCYASEQKKIRSIIHGQRYSRPYKIWSDMKARCFNPKENGYHNYGGRGITVCDEWLVYQNFESWAIETGYEKGLTIERIDFNNEYCPENCKWATWKEQQNNKRNNKYLEYKGRKQTLAQWCEELGLNYSRTKARINACGWTVEEAFEREKYAQVNLGK